MKDDIEINFNEFVLGRIHEFNSIQQRNTIQLNIDKTGKVGF